MYNKKKFWLLVAPALLLFTIVLVIPFILGVAYSFTSWRSTYFATGDNIFTAFIGIENYINAFQSERFIDSFIYTIRYTILALIFINTSGLALALILTKLTKASGLFRTAFFIPNLLGGLVLGFIWSFIFEIVFTYIIFQEGGILDMPVFRFMLQDRDRALYALVIMTTWQFAGYMMIIFVAAINNVPKSLYEASSIAGASKWRQFRSITVPMIMPAFTVTLFLTLSNSFKLLDQNLSLTEGEFNTRMLALQILRTTQDSTPPDYGMAQAQAVIFFILIASVTLFQVVQTKKREVEM